MRSGLSDNAHAVVRRRVTTTVVKTLVTVCLLLLTATGSTHAYLYYPGEGGWSSGIKHVNEFAIVMGTGYASPRTLDTFDGYDEPAYVSNSGWTGGSYHVNGTSGWDGPSGFYYTDLRPPLVPGETKTWILYIWAVPGAATSNLLLQWESATNSLVLGQLEYIQKPAGISGGPGAGYGVDKSS